MVSTEHGILVAANTGLYAIENQQANKIIKNKNINSISKQPDNNKFYIATNNGISLIHFDENE
ncbi:MAG: hypothetical protein U9P82_06655 [Bacteroidota bacterium]|nr:hypothetical protein [Bacteroidota bacterium]